MSTPNKRFTSTGIKPFADLNLGNPTAEVTGVYTKGWNTETLGTLMPEVEVTIEAWENNQRHSRTFVADQAQVAEMMVIIGAQLAKAVNDYITGENGPIEGWQEVIK